MDWDARYRAERTPWERPSLNPAFLAWRAAGTLSPCRILCPGLGRSGELLAMARDRFDVTGVDLSPTAIAVQRVRLEAAGLPGTLHQADLLAWDPAEPFDVIYDQTCLCALPPELWPDYAARLHQWLKPGGRLFILFMQSELPGGPPFHCALGAMQVLFGEGWQWPDQHGPAVAAMSGHHELPSILVRL